MRRIGDIKMIRDSKFEVRNPEPGPGCHSRISNLESRIRPTKLSALFVFISLLLISARAWGQDAQVTASVGSDTVGIQDQFQLKITVSGRDSGDAENPRLLNLKGFRVVSGPNISTQYQWINGRASSSRSFIYILIPEKEGQFTIDPVEVRIGGKTYKTQPLQVRVTSAPQNRAPQTQRPLSPFDDFEEEVVPRRRSVGDAVFVKAELDRASAYPGQQVTLSYEICTQVGINGIQIQENPPLSGFWVEDIEVEKNPKGIRRVINGSEYVIYTIKKQALFATTTGKLRIPSSTFAISAGVGGDLFGIFSRTETLYRKTDELILDVKPLPIAGRPADFRNAVGSFNLTADIDKTQVATGEAVALRVKLEGTGNLKMIPDISVPPIPDFTVYSSKRVDGIRPQSGSQIGGNKTWEYVIVPKAPGRQTIPSLSFSFFNPERDKYEVVATPPLNLSVVRGTDSVTSTSGLPGSDKQNLVRRGTDINFIKSTSGDLEKTDRPFYHSLWIYLIAGIPIAFNAGVFFYQKQRSRHAEDTGFFRNRSARRRALERLKIADKKSKSDARSFYDEAAAALSGYLTDKFGLAEIELTGDGLERALSAKSIPRQIVEDTRACLQECDFGRFVSASASADGTSKLSERIRKNIGALENAGRASFPSYVLILSFIFLFSPWNLHAAPGQQSPGELFAQGNSEYQTGNYASAEQFYRRVLHSGYDSGSLFYNLGNACFKQKRLGDAIYYWEKARQKLPADREIRENLELANSLIVDRIETSANTLPLRMLSGFPGLLTITQEAWLVAALFIIANLLFSFYQLSKNPRNSYRALLGCLGVGVLFVVFATSLSWKVYDQDFRKKGVVIEQKVDVRSGPGLENISVFTIHEGLKVRVHGSNNGWYQISLPNGWSGWLMQNCVRIL
jgi:tetratricopeptide (TPR) repeat protein